MENKITELENEIKQLKSALFSSERFRREDAFSHINEMNLKQEEINKLKRLVAHAWNASRDSFAFETGAYDLECGNAEYPEPEYKDWEDFKLKNNF